MSRAYVADLNEFAHQRDAIHRRQLTRGAFAHHRALGFPAAHR
jgi:hypothetical protein